MRKVVKSNKSFRGAIIEHVLCISQLIGESDIILQIDESLVLEKNIIVVERFNNFELLEV